MSPGTCKMRSLYAGGLYIQVVSRAGLLYFYCNTVISALGKEKKTLLAYKPKCILTI